MINKSDNCIANFTETLDKQIESIFFESRHMFGIPALTTFDWSLLKTVVQLLLANASLKVTPNQRITFNEVLDTSNRRHYENFDSESFKRALKSKRDTVKRALKKNVREFTNTFETYNNFNTIKMITGEAYSDWGDYAFNFTPKISLTFYEEYYPDLYKNFYSTVFTCFGENRLRTHFLLNFLSCRPIEVDDSALGDKSLAKLVTETIERFFRSYLEMVEALLETVLENKVQSGIMVYLIEKHFNIQLVYHIISTINMNKNINMEEIKESSLLYEFLMNRLTCIWMLNCSPMPINNKAVDYFLTFDINDSILTSGYMQRKENEYANLRFADTFISMNIGILSQIIRTVPPNTVGSDGSIEESKKILSEYSDGCSATTQSIKDILNNYKNNVMLSQGTCILIDMIFEARSIVYHDSFFGSLKIR